MQITSKSIAGKKVVFESIIDEIPGGAGLNVTRLDNTKVDADLSVNKTYLPAGVPVYYDPDTRIAEVCKSATALASSTAQAIRVNKNYNHFKAGDLINDGTTTATISSITLATSTEDYDIIVTDAALTYAEGTKYGQGSATGTSTALLYTPNGLTKNQVYIGQGNADVAIVTIGEVREDALSFPIPTLYATALRGTKSLITLR